MHLYFKNNRVAMWSEDLIDAPNLLHIEKELTPDELNKLESNYETTVKDDKVEQTQPPSQTEEQKEDRRTLVESLKEQAGAAKTVTDLKNILNQILTTIE